MGHPNNPATKTRICPAGKARPAGCTLTTLRPKPESAQLGKHDQLVAPLQPCDQNQNLPSWESKTSWLHPDNPRPKKKNSPKKKKIDCQPRRKRSRRLAIHRFIYKKDPAKVGALHSTITTSILFNTSSEVLQQPASLS